MGGSPLHVPENLWTAITWSRSFRLGLEQQEDDLRNGKIRLFNEDALPPEDQ